MPPAFDETLESSIKWNLIEGAYAVLLSVSRGYSAEEGTFPRVTHPSAAIPEGIARLACVKPAASVRSEPGSNSQVETPLPAYRTFEPVPDSRTSAHLIRRLDPMNSLSDAHRFQGNNARSNSEADTGHRTSRRTPYRRDMQTSVRQNRPNRPHISSDTSHVKEQETKPTECANQARPANPASIFSKRPAVIPPVDPSAHPVLRQRRR